jgi:broad specificity phosphatase PhoE
MRRRLYLMRHAEVVYFEPDGTPIRQSTVPLTGRGREQARAAGRALKSVRFDRVVTSGLPRTKETAELVLAELDHPPDTPVDASALVEPRGGDIAAIPDEELEEAFLNAFRGSSPREAKVLAGETIGSLLDRILPAFEEIFDADGEWDTMLAVLHAGVNRAIVSTALAGEPAFFGHMEQAPACINILDHGPDWIVRAVNVTPYDPAHLGPRTTTMEELLAAYMPARLG